VRRRLRERRQLEVARLILLMLGVDPDNPEQLRRLRLLLANPDLWP